MPTEVLLLFGLILLNGVFAMSEIALVTARRARLQALVEQGDIGAAAALALNDEPTRFLSTIQVGITSIGILSGIVGEAAFAEPLARLADRARRRTENCSTRRNGTGRGRRHVLLDRARRTGAEAAGSDLGRGDCAPRGATDCLAGAGREAVRTAADGVDRPDAAGDRRAFGRIQRRHRRGDPRADQGRLGNRRDRRTGTRDGAQRVPARRPADRIADDAALGNRLPGSRRRPAGQPAPGARHRALALPGVPWRPARCRRRGECAPAAAAGHPRRCPQPRARGRAGGLRARVADGHGTAGELSRQRRAHGAGGRRVRRDPGARDLAGPVRGDRRRVQAAAHRGCLGGAARRRFVAARRADPDSRTEGST